MARKVKINDFEVVPMKMKEDKRPIQGEIMFPEVYCATYIVGKKKSGKTHLMMNIILNRVLKNTTGVIYSSTLYCDPVWLGIMDCLEKKGIGVIKHTSMFDSNGNNTLKELFEQLEDEAQERYEDSKKSKKDKKEIKVILCKDDECEEGKDRKPKKRAPDWLIVIDDLSDEIKDNSLTALVKKHRHHLSQLIISSQTLNDLSVSARKQLNYWILFRDINEAKLQEIYDQQTLSISFPQFLALYKDAVSKPFSFFYFSTSGKPDFRQNFDIRYKI